jgi:hypothetical protein
VIQIHIRLISDGAERGAIGTPRWGGGGGGGAGRGQRPHGMDRYRLYIPLATTRDKLNM